MKNTLLSIGAVLAVAFLCFGFFFLGDMRAVQSMSIKRVAPNQIATAMQQDHFYTDYRRSTLLVTGEIIAATKTDDTIRLTFKTSSTYGAQCDLAKGTVVPKSGRAVTLISEGGTALRQPHGVLLVKCTPV